ncbi:unnamed protein product [Triticum turgidum subsp. durum]|uniref:Terpene synthase metal-binding domain-containing protein n=1 Tax=Triticum turgidum subsp. durum TaxID=4567 RepID=A0A9R0WY90_TRITD|nr:unnamed protein product [Triticum turgidum subsp. durum]
MKFLYSNVLATMKAIEKDLDSQGNKHADYVKKLLIDATKCYYNETKWREESDTLVTVDEHLRFSVPSSCCMHVACLAFVVIGVSRDTIEWGMTYPKIMQASCIIGRVMNDVASHEREQEQCSSERNVMSTVEACMEENNYTKEEEAYRKLKELIEESWIDIIEEHLKEAVGRPTTPVLEAVLNSTRMLDFLYKDKDAYTDPRALKVVVDSIYVNHI